MPDWTAPALLDTTSAYWQGCAIMAAVNLDLFRHLADTADSAAGLARRLSLDPRALGMLLRALAALELLEQEGERYRCTPAAARLLVPDSPDFLGNIITHHHHLLESWGKLDQAVRSGQPQRTRVSFSEAQWRESFLLGMQNLANLTAPKLVPRIEIGRRTRMLDLGGGPATWAIHFCRQHPALQVRVFDLPGSREFAETAIQKAGLAERIHFQGGDFNQDPLPSGNDMVWMSQILHSEGIEHCQALIDRAAATLTDEGLLLIHEFILDDEGAGPLHPALFALNMLLGTDRGCSYREGELREMLQTAGLDHIERLALPAASRSGIILARKTTN